MNAKATGTAREHRSMALLETAGYRCTRAVRQAQAAANPLRRDSYLMGSMTHGFARLPPSSIPSFGNTS